MRNLWKNSRKALAVVLAIVMTMGLAACGGSQPAASPSSEESTASTGAQSATSTAKGFGGDVSVTVTVADGKITEVVAEGPGETRGCGFCCFGAAAPQDGFRTDPGCGCHQRRHHYQQGCSGSGQSCCDRHGSGPRFFCGNRRDRRC